MIDRTQARAPELRHEEYLNTGTAITPTVLAVACLIGLLFACKPLGYLFKPGFQRGLA